VNDVLYMSRLEAGKLQLEWLPIQLHKTCETLVMAYR
jgi:hypothetical protein